MDTPNVGAGWLLSQPTMSTGVASPGVSLPVSDPLFQLDGMETNDQSMEQFLDDDFSWLGNAATTAASASFVPAPTADPSATIVDLDAMLRMISENPMPGTASIEEMSPEEIETDSSRTATPPALQSAVSRTRSLSSSNPRSPKFVFVDPFQLPSSPRLSPASPNLPDDLASMLLRLHLESEPYAILPVVHRPSFAPSKRPPWMLWAMMAASARFHPDLDRMPANGKRPPEGWGEKLYKAAADAVGASVLASAPSVETIVGLLYMIIFAASSKDPQRGLESMRWLSLAIGMARELGLHKEPAANLSFVQREERRRAWWFVWGFDRLLSSLADLPPMIPRHHAQVRLFSSVDAWESQEDGIDDTATLVDGEGPLLPLIESVDPPPTVDDLSHYAARIQYMDHFIHRASSLSSRLAAKGLTEFGPDSEQASLKRTKVATAMDRWAEAEERFAYSFSNEEQAEYASRAWEGGEHRWFGWHTALVYLYSPRVAIDSIARGESDDKASKAIEAWLKDGESVGKARRACRMAAAWIGELVRLDRLGENRRFDRRLGFVGYSGSQVAYCAMVWLLSSGAVEEGGAEGVAAAPPDKVGYSRMSAPPIKDAEVLPTFVAGLRGMGKVWGVAHLYADGVEKMAAALACGAPMDDA